MISIPRHDHVVAFLVNCNKLAGGGHLSRCLTIANKLKSIDIPSLFMAITDASLIPNRINAQGHWHISLNSKDLKKDILQAKYILKDLHPCKVILVIDHYNIDDISISQVKKYVRKVVVIDDLADRKLNCDLLINQVYKMEAAAYRNLVPAECKLLLGSNFAILKPQFLEMRKSILREGLPTHVKRINLLFSSGDPLGLSLLFAKIIINNFQNIEVLINTTSNSNIKEQLKSLCIHSASVQCIIDSENVAQDMSSCQFAIGTPGMSTWERACLGIPSIQIGSSTNQIPIMKMLHQEKLCYWLGMPSDLNHEAFIVLLDKLLHDTKWRHDVRESCMLAIDGLGTERVTKSIVHLL